MRSLRKPQFRFSRSLHRKFRFIRKNPPLLEIFENININLIDNGQDPMTWDEFKEWYSNRTGIKVGSPKKSNDSKTSFTGSSSLKNQLLTKLEFYRKKPVKFADKIFAIEEQLKEL